MAPTTYDYGTIIILDIGKNTASNSNDKQSFFSQAQQCAAKIIERNIMIQSKNLVGIIVLGSKKTNNELASQCPGAFKHINVMSELKLPTWQMIRDLPSEPSEKKGDWFEALIVAAHHYKNGISNCKITSKKMVLLTNFEGSARIGSNFDEVVEGFKDENFELYVIGPDLQAMEGKNIEYINKFLEETEGDHATFEEAVSGWLFHKKKASKMVPQNFDLSIGEDIKIPVSIYIRIKDEPIVKKWQKAVRDPVTLGASTTEGVKTERKIINTENQSAMDVSETVEAYIYGQKIIPFSDGDKAMLYQSGERSLMVYGFTKAENIKWQNLHGDCTYYLFGKKNDKNANLAINCLVHCLHELNLVGLVRKVHCKNFEPKMFALMPVIDIAGYVCLSLIGICYKEEIKSMAFPSTELKKFKTTDEQVNAFKDLINAMDLTKAYDDTFNDPEAFPIAETVSPSIQYVLDCISFRALNPGKPLPQPRDEIMTLFKVPPLIEKRSRDPIENLKKLFPLKKIEKKTTRRIKQTASKDEQYAQTSEHSIIDIPKIDLPKMNTDVVENIGTVEPTKDFKTLLSQGKKLNDLAKEMTEVIENLVYTNSHNTKVLETIKSFRTECVKNHPEIYNNWLKKFKRNLLDRKRDAVINLIHDNNVNFILKSENESSDYTEENSVDDSQVYDNDTIPNTVELSIRSDVNDLFDDM